jgi:GcrA cell cycle regulator
MTDWNSELDSQARSMWDDGLSASQIGNAIGRSTNSVISRAHRCNWGSRRVAVPRRPKCAIPKPSPEPKKAKTTNHSPVRLGPKPLPVVPPPPPNFDSTKVEFVEATRRQCKFIFGDCSPWFACGAAVVPSLPYCEYHCRMCYAGRR